MGASSSHEDVSVLIEFDATSGLTERVAWVKDGRNLFECDLFFFRPLENNEFFMSTWRVRLMGCWALVICRAPRLSTAIWVGSVCSI